MSRIWTQTLLRFPMFFIFLLAYGTVHLLFEINFWSSGPATVFTKYATVTDSGSGMGIAGQVYYTKATWFFLLILLQASGLRFYAALSVSFFCYSIQLLLFFPPQLYSFLNLLLATGMLIEVVVRRNRELPGLWAMLDYRRRAGPAGRGR